MIAPEGRALVADDLQYKGETLDGLTLTPTPQRSKK